MGELNAEFVNPFLISATKILKDMCMIDAKIGKPYIRDNNIDSDCAVIMLGVTGHLSVYVPDGYQLYTKTGTAETGAGDDYLYITGCLKNNNDPSSGCPVYEDYSDYRNGGSYIIIMQIQNPKDHGFEFASNSGSLYQGIINILLS